MNEVGPDQTIRRICPTCGKPVPDNKRRGSLTSFLFGASYCACAESGGAGLVAPKPLDTQHGDDSDFCPECGLKIVTDASDGSLTGFLFFYTRCKCASNERSGDGRVSSRLRKGQSRDSGTTFELIAGQANQSAKGEINMAEGAIIGGAYKIIKMIGSGGMGQVYLARHEALGKKCALKVIPPEQVTNESWMRFQLEAKVIAKLEHINLVRVTDLGIHEDRLPFYAMDYVQGQNLAEILEASGPMPLATVLDIFMQVCDGIDHAHRNGVMHRDLKPANIMVTVTADNKLVAKVLDFGLVKQIHHSRSKQSLTEIGDIFGSPMYMSPEQCTGAKLDRRTDIYSLGCTLFECLTGRPPFLSDVPAKIIFSHMESDPPLLESIVGKGKISNSLEVVVAKLLRKNPVERYQTLLELRGDLEKISRGEEVQPIYISRGMQARGAAKAGATPTKNKDKTGQPSIPLFSLPTMLITVSALMVAMGLAYVLISLTSHSSERQRAAPAIKTASTGGKEQGAVSAAPKETAGAAAVATAAGPGPAIDLTPFSSIVKGENGEDRKLFKFPTESIGVISYEITNNLNQSKDYAANCHGNVTLPVNTGLRFQPYAICFTKPEYLDRLRANDIDTITFEDVDEKVPLTNAPFEHITHLSGLANVKFDTCYAVNDGVVDSLEKLPNLRSLTITDTPISVARLAKAGFVRKLKSLRIETSASVTPLLEALKGSTAIETLWLTAPLKHSDFELIGTLKHMRTLATPFCSATNEDLEAVSGLPWLYDINLQKNNITYSALPIFKKMYGLNLRRANLLSSSMPQQDYDRLKQDVPGIEFQFTSKLLPP